MIGLPILLKPVPQLLPYTTLTVRLVTLLLPSRPYCHLRKFKKNELSGGIVGQDAGDAGHDRVETCDHGVLLMNCHEVAALAEKLARRLVQLHATKKVERSLRTVVASKTRPQRALRLYVIPIERLVAM